ncbi:UDP-N-acetylglucosamine 1-carboxyvinyltransferase [Candidatus Microgenomates bacterium]|nr:UDP-N-acetylglucosamine 1-carboxyvinyltransferase [Candidatus Microgenomates bacterium]
MTKYIVTGGNPIRGSIKLAGAKNAGFKAMIASLMGDSPSQICRLGLISEINFAKEIITSLGGSVSSLSDEHDLFIDPTNINSFTVPKEIGSKSRSVTMYVGPLLMKFGKAILPTPGGDPISTRPIDRHIEGLTAFGAKVEFADGAYHVEAPNGLRGTRFRFRKNTHTGTETLLMCAVWAKGESILENAAAEPEIDDLITLLNSMGAQIMRLDARTIRVMGVKKLRGVKHTVMLDRIEAATFACITYATKGDVTVIGADPLVLTAFLEKTNEVGGRWEKTADGIRFWYENELTATDVTASTYPQFMTDWQPMWTALMTQAQGISTVHETVYESRLDHINDLAKMGANFELFNPPVLNPEETYNFNLEDDQHENMHAVRIFGPVELKSAEIEIHDIRRGATVLLAGLAANGQTTISDPKGQVARGYENLIERLKVLGANITISSD